MAFQIKTEDNRDVRVYTRREAWAIIGCPHLEYINMVVDRGDIEDLGYAKKPGTEVLLKLLNADDVDRYAKAYKAKKHSPTHRYQINLRPEDIEPIVDALNRFAANEKDTTAIQIARLMEALLDAIDLTKKNQNKKLVD